MPNIEAPKVLIPLEVRSILCGTRDTIHRNESVPLVGFFSVGSSRLMHGDGFFDNVERRTVIEVVRIRIETFHDDRQAFFN